MSEGGLPGGSQPTATLLETSGFASEQTDVCMESLTEGAERRNVLAVLLTGTVDGWLDRWRATTNARPERLGFVTTGDQFRSAMGHTSGDVAVSQGGRTVIRGVSSADDLTGLQIAIGEFLDDWASTDEETVVCFDSVTVLLQYVDRTEAYRFLHKLTGRAWHEGASVHAHLDPTTVDDRTWATIAPLFDQVVSSTD